VFGDVERHAEAAALGVLASCEDAVVRQLLDMLERAGRDPSRDGDDADEELFAAAGRSGI
jgi:hypothetical protein